MKQAIEPDDALLRRVTNDPNLWTRKEGRLRVSSAAMSPHPEDGLLSVDARKLIPEPSDPLTAPCLDQGAPEDGLAELVTRVVLDLGLSANHDAQPDNPAHVNIKGFETMSAKQAKRAQRELAKKATWIREPAGAAQD